MRGYKYLERKYQNDDNSILALLIALFVALFHDF